MEGEAVKDAVLYFLGSLGISVMLWLMSWMIVGVLLTDYVVEDTCESGAQYESGLRDWQWVGLWPIATDYQCGAR